jgi:hypothetical protein
MTSDIVRQSSFVNRQMEIKNEQMVFNCFNFIPKRVRGDRAAYISADTFGAERTEGDGSRQFFGE